MDARKSKTHHNNFNTIMTQQINAIAITEPRNGEITYADLDGFYTFEFFGDGESIGYIQHDAVTNPYEPWVVTLSLNSEVLYRANAFDDAKTWLESGWRFHTLYNAHTLQQEQAA